MTRTAYMPGLGVMPGEWVDYAACVGSPARFFPLPSDVGSTSWMVPALRLCQRCPVRSECLQHAVEHNEQGIWGGTYHTERRQMGADL